jgi:adenosylhomocysteine/aminodeoxyfutalosine nucleosidase
MYALLSAMDSESRAVRAAMEIARVDRWKGYEFSIGRLEGADVVVARTGVGKILSAMITQKIIDSYAPDAVFFSGIGGALNPAYGIGDIVIGTESMQHDLDATVFGFKRGEVPYSGYRLFICDTFLCDAAENYLPRDHSLFFGRILTGDQFLTQADKAGFNYLRTELKGDVVDMEGAAVAQVAVVNEVSHILIRVISDCADGAAPKSFERFLPKASLASLQLLRYIIRRVSAG